MKGRERILATLEGRQADSLQFMPITMMFAADQIGAPTWAGSIASSTRLPISRWAKSRATSTRPVTMASGWNWPPPSRPRAPAA